VTEPHFNPTILSSTQPAKPQPAQSLQGEPRMEELTPIKIEDKSVHGPRISVTFREFAPKHTLEQDHNASLKSAKLANHGSRVSRNRAALVPAIEKIEHIEYQAPDFKDAKELRAAFDEADKEVKTKANTAIDSQAEVIIALAKVQAILSQRGKEKMRREAGIKLTWSRYYESFQNEFNFEPVLRTVQYKIAELAGRKRNRKCPECQKTSGHATSCSKHKEPTPPHLTPLEAKLLDAASRAHWIVKAVRKRGNVDEAIADFESNAPTPEKLIEYAERRVKPSLAHPDPQPITRSGNGRGYLTMLIDLLDQVEKLGPRLPIELHVKCKQFRTRIGLPPNVVSDPNWNAKAEQEENPPDVLEKWNNIADWDEGAAEERTDLPEPDGIEY
jgi:hypothetical protein